MPSEKITMPHEIANAPASVREHWLRMIAAGQSERWSTMCALQQPPGTRGTDRAFQQGRLDGNWLDELPARQAKKMVREAKAAGINIAGKQYVSGLANKLGHCDPQAWVSDLSDVRRVAKARNLTVTGSVNVEGVDYGPKKVDINPKIARTLAKKEMAASPGLSMRDAMAKVKEKYVPRWKRKSK